MGNRQKKYREWLILLLLLPFSVVIMYWFGILALRQPPAWVVKADMNSMIDPSTYQSSSMSGKVEQVRSGIMTAPAWMGSFLTPQPDDTSTSKDVISQTSATPEKVLTTESSPAIFTTTSTVTVNNTVTPIATATLTPIPTNTPLPISTIYFYYAPPPAPTKTKKPKPPATNTPLPEADLSITKDNASTNYTPGNPILPYTIIVSNAGPDDVTGATVIDIFDTSILENINWTCDSSPSCAGNGDINDTVDLPAGTSITYTVNADALDTAAEPLTNTASVTVPSGISDPDLSNNTDSDTPDDPALSYCKDIINVSAPSVVDFLAGGIHCVRFNTRTNGVTISVTNTGSSTYNARWVGLDQNLSGNCGDKYLEKLASGESLTDIFIAKDTDIILSILSTHSGQLTVNSLADWASPGCPP